MSNIVQHVVIGDQLIHGCETISFHQEPPFVVEWIYEPGETTSNCLKLLKAKMKASQTPLRISFLAWANDMPRLQLEHVGKAIRFVEKLQREFPLHKVAFPEMLFVPEFKDWFWFIDNMNAMLNQYNHEQGFTRYSTFRIGAKIRGGGKVTALQKEWLEGFHLKEPQKLCEMVRWFHEANFCATPPPAVSNAYLEELLQQKRLDWLQLGTAMEFVHELRLIWQNHQIRNYQLSFEKLYVLSHGAAAMPSPDDPGFEDRTLIRQTRVDWEKTGHEYGFIKELVENWDDERALGVEQARAAKAKWRSRQVEQELVSAKRRQKKLHQKGAKSSKPAETSNSSTELQGNSVDPRDTSKWTDVIDILSSEEDN